MNPMDLLVDLFKSAAGGIVVLAEMFLKHALAEEGVIPGDIVALGPSKGRRGAIEDLEDFHMLWTAQGVCDGNDKLNYS